MLCQPKPGLLVTLHFYNPVAVAEWTKCMGMVTPVIGSSLHLGSLQYDVINRLYDEYQCRCQNWRTVGHGVRTVAVELRTLPSYFH